MSKPKSVGGVGFRNLSTFNDALLAKKAWRLIQNPNSLVSRVFEAKYFPRTEFFHAKLGSRPSLSWRSIFDANGRWIESNVRATFHPSDADEILCIPLGNGDHEDTLIWHFNTNGKFTVRSAHHLALELHRRNLASNSMMKTQGDWKFLWNRRALPKVKVFGWKLCTNALPTMHNLTKRNPGVDNVCSVCRAKDEDSKHILLHCPVARQVWALSDIPWRVVSDWSDDAEEWLRHVSTKLEANDTDRALRKEKTY
ncbi:putative mitochondrial protein [Sesamum alatum]|uniref:Mitochondrial protein n=1 Tax=Sesamum alatum TaxID=300844 RepID=A0AAE1YYP8_9LAMI|nr:putative mitochondrial protein [Sesamum alatum]